MSVSISMHALEDPALKKIADISGENVYRCMQCGTCSAVCPMAESMDVTTRQAMLLLQHGRTETLVASESPWVCASCHTCQVRCPRGIEVPRVMEAVRQLVLRQNVDRINPRAIDSATVAQMPQIALVSGFRKLTA